MCAILEEIPFVSNISGTYGAFLKIDDPRSSAAMCRPRQKEGKLPPRLYRETSFEPKTGRLIMFPAWLLHCVDPNESNDIRISVSFNFLQKCMIV